MAHYGIIKILAGQIDLGFSRREIGYESHVFHEEHRQLSPMRRQVHDWMCSAIGDNPRNIRGVIHTSEDKNQRNFRNSYRQFRSHSVDPQFQLRSRCS